MKQVLLILLLSVAVGYGQSGPQVGIPVGGGITLPSGTALSSTEVSIVKSTDATSELVISGARTTSGGHSSRLKLLAPASPSTTGQKSFMIVNQNGAVGGQNTIRVRALSDDGASTVRDITTFMHNGSVGIGTIIPDAAAKLEVAGQVKITGGSPGSGKVLTSDVNGLATWETISTGPTAASGEFTPTCTADFQVFQCSINTGSWRYLQIGNTVQVSGRLIVKSSVIGDLSRAKLSLPVASDFIDTQDASGGGGRFLNDSTTPAAQFHVSADDIGNDISLYFVHTDDANWEGHVQFMYRIR